MPKTTAKKITVKKNIQKSEDTVKPSKPLPLGIKIAIGCVGVLVILGIIIGAIGSVIFSKIGLNIGKKVIENRTGITVDEKNGVAIKDQKTGAEVNLGSGKIPSNFPKDFPIYPGAKVEGNISGSETAAQKGFWLILSTTDASDKVAAYYETNLPSNGWTIGSTMNVGASSTWEVTKNDLTGGVVIGSDDKTKGTSIVITLGTKETQPTVEPTQE